MPATGKISLDATDYKRTLDEVKNKTKGTADEMSKAVGKFGSDVGKAGGAVKALSAEVSGSFGQIGKVISSVAAGPVAILTAAFGTLVAIGVQVWDDLTLSAEEYAMKLSAQIEMEDKHLSKLKEEQKAEKDYMERLNELAGHEFNSNAEKTEAIRLVQILTDKYGDLGISVDEATGRIIGLAEAEEKLNNQMKQQTEKQLENVIGLKRNEVAANVRGELMPQNIAMKIRGFFTGETEEAESNADIFKNLSTRGQLEFAQNIVNGNEQEGISESKNKEEIAFWNEQIRKLNEIIQLEEQLNSLRKTGKLTQTEETDELEKQSKQERRILDSLQSFFDGVDEEEQKLAEAEKKRAADAEAEIQKQQAAQYDAWQKEQQRQAEAEKKWNEKRRDSIRNTKWEIMRASGQGNEANIESALASAESMKGSALTDQERSQVIEMAKMKNELSGFNFTAPLDYAPRVNSLVARGGSDAPVSMPKIEDLQAQTLNNVKSIKDLATRFLDAVESWGTF